jgi:hypothetical protein
VVSLLSVSLISVFLLSLLFLHLFSLPTSTKVNHQLRNMYKSPILPSFLLKPTL